MAEEQEGKWHGWGHAKKMGRTDVSLGITQFPDRKNPCLIVSKSNGEKGAWMYALAYFKDERSALEGQRLLDHFILGVPLDEEEEARSDNPQHR